MQEEKSLNARGTERDANYSLTDDELNDESETSAKASEEEVDSDDEE
jgi:hypothetical protein